jgi:hypothetical protein
MIELRWMKLNSAAADVKPVLQYRQSHQGNYFEDVWTDWAMVPLVFVEYPDDKTGASHSSRYPE